MGKSVYQALFLAKILAKILAKKRVVAATVL